MQKIEKYLEKEIKKLKETIVYMEKQVHELNEMLFEIRRLK